MTQPWHIVALAFAVTAWTAGCATRRATPVAVVDPPIVVAASALAYAPPAVRDLPRDVSDDLDVRLARAGREETALLGYDTPRVSTYLLDVNDRQFLLGGGGFGGFGITGRRGFGGGFGSVGGGRATDALFIRERTVSTFDRVRPPGN